MLAPVVALLAGGLILGVLPGLAEQAHQAAQQLLDPAGYAAAALDGAVAVPATSTRVESWSLSGVLMGGSSALLALLVAAVGLYTYGLPQLLRRAAGVLILPMRVLRAAHSGHLGDYVVWLLLGVTLLTSASPQAELSSERSCTAGWNISRSGRMDTCFGVGPRQSVRSAEPIRQRRGWVIRWRRSRRYP
jgi:hypothetical protein